MGKATRLPNKELKLAKRGRLRSFAARCWADCRSRLGPVTLSQDRSSPSGSAFA
jgi:hypothetical protein